MALRFITLFLCIGFIHAKLVSLSCAQIREFVNEHNVRRFEVASGKVSGQPPAATMKTMVWDEELAAKAAKWAAQNKFEHNPDRSVASERFKTGENLYVYGTTAKGFNFKPKMAIDSWYDEQKDYTFGTLTVADFGKSLPTGHYTQMLWWNTTRVGCAISQYKQGKFNKFLVVCNYGPAGNMIGQTIYQKGNGVKHLSCEGKDCSNKYGKKC